MIISPLSYLDPIRLPPDLFLTKFGLLASLVAALVKLQSGAVAALPFFRVRARVESCPCPELFMWLVNQHRVHWRRNRLLQQFALSPWDSYPERLVNASSVFDNLWVFECRVWRRKGGEYTHVKCSHSGYCSNWKSKDSVVCFSVFISSSNRHANPWLFFSSSCGDYNHSEKGMCCKEDWKFTCPSDIWSKSL